MDLTDIEAAERLSYLIDAKYIRIERIVTIAGDYGDGDTTEYRVSLQAWNAWIDVPYTVGPGVAFIGDSPATRWPWDKSASAITIRRRIREAYRPTVLDVVSAVLLDIASADGCADWADWAVELGSEFRTADDIRKSQQAYALVTNTFRPWAERAFGVDLPEAIGLAGAL